MGLAKCAGTKISYNGTLPQSLSRYLQFYTNIAVFRGKSGWILAEKIFEIKRKEVWISLSNLQRDLC